jgi:tetratricopeptide (TPR) repeat protein
MGKVFISYSHDSREHADRVLTFADRLIEEGVDCVLDQYEESPAEGWNMWMDRQIKGADFVLMVCTETYYKRVMGEEKPGAGFGVKWEGKLIYQHIYQADSQNTRFIPILFKECTLQNIPTALRDATRYYVDSDEGYENLYRRLTNQPKIKKPELGKLKTLPPRGRKQDFFAPQVYLAKLPTTHAELFGRETELKLLDDAWADLHTHILTLVAWGGVGKTALTNEWLSRLERENYRGAERVYGWSFYSQGTREDRQASGDEFLADALAWFGYDGPELKSPWDKGVKLAELARQHKALFILDGLEPLQYPPGEMYGHLRDQGVAALLKQLARSNAGLCVVSTRVAVKDIEHTRGKSTVQIDLENLSPEAGAQLLRHAGVKGTDKELRAAAADFKGHALALSLLGSYLAAVHEGEIRKRDLIPQLTEDEAQGGHARRVMASYEHWLQGTAELDILYLMGLFDRPAAKGALDTLLAPPAIAGLTANAQNLPVAKWQFAVKRLRELRLLAEKDETRPDTLDCHPLVREHFGEKLPQQNPAAWKEAHSRLYEYYKNLTAKELPDTLEEMEPLFAAVAHGCLAGRHQKTLDDIYWTRILRGQEAYTVHKLGAFGADLSALSNFFEVVWSRPAHGLTDADKAVILSWAGFGLRALGRLREASQPMQAAVQNFVDQKDWRQAALNANNLSELYLTLGEVSQAVTYARQSVDFADRSGHGFQKESKRTIVADALHQSGESTEAHQLFREAESMQQQRQPEYPYLYSLQGFQFCDLLLNQKQWQEVQKRARQTLEWSTQQRFLLDIALDKLSLGRAFLLEATSPLPTFKGGIKGGVPLSQRGTTGGFAKASDYLNQAVAGLRESAYQYYVPLGLLARAALFRVQGEFAKAWEDLEETQEIAERGEMNLHLADYHLEACRVNIAESIAQSAEREKQKAKREKAKEHVETAAEMIEKMGYGRRKPEVVELRQQLSPP